MEALGEHLELELGLNLDSLWESPYTMAHPRNPRNLPSSRRGSASFTPRRTYARARASREHVNALGQIERNLKSQARFIRNLKITINIICALGIIGLLIYTIVSFQSPKPKPPTMEESTKDR